MRSLAIKRFWDKVDKSGSCWIWIAGIRGKSGYGAFKYSGITHSAHRISWYLHTGRPPKKWVLHKCDNKICVIPEHLLEGTAKDNVADMDQKGRRGSAKGQIRTIHGTITMYSKHKCRCVKCKKAKSNALKRQRKTYSLSSVDRVPF